MNVDSVTSSVSPRKPIRKDSAIAKVKFVQGLGFERAKKRLNDSVIMNEQKEMTNKQRKIQRQVYRNALVQ